MPDMRMVVFMLCGLALLGLAPWGLAPGAGPGTARAQKAEAEGYSIRRPGRAGLSSREALPAGATGIRAVQLPEGRVDVLCGRSASSLWDCLNQARKHGRGTIDLPPGVGLAHVVDFFRGALRYYDLDSDFSRYRGYRFVMRFRMLRDDEIEERRNLRAGSLGAGLAGGAALGVLTPYLPLTPVLFLVDTAQAEADLDHATEDAARRGVPLPDRGSLETTYEDYQRRYEGYMQGSLSPSGEEGVLAEYAVTQCYIARPRERKPLRLVEDGRWTVPAQPRVPSAP
ncbi:hypothetical protein dsx2_1458 [Desulfovibrio sp. X2]|uniref:hypothetical protein n=1 Tax=Desulfovibrio sp. X2 TaxID=941449 RepID=UPI0003587D4F|nr:hypothetical protein [Desulfovibrio sp. X2]EPR44499.1 hypothetical protein dsx2_1458 [Desulfovibrio sp. X2]